MILFYDGTHCVLLVIQMSHTKVHKTIRRDQLLDAAN